MTKTSKLPNYGIKQGYVSRLNNAYYDDFTGTTIWQPDVYTALIKLARRRGIKTIIDIGSGNGEKLVPYKDEFKFIFVDFGTNLDVIKKNIGVEGNEFIDQDFEKGFPVFSKKVLQDAMVICSDVIEHMRNPEILAGALASFSHTAPFVLISTPDRPRTRGVSHFGPPDNQTHVREWAVEELDSYFRAHGMAGHLAGITRSNDYEQAHRTIMIIAGTFFSNLCNKPKVRAEVGVIYSTDLEYAKDYLWSEDAVIAEAGKTPDVQLGKNEWLAFPSPLISLGSIITDAKEKGYSHIAAQVIYVNPHPRYNWPKAGIIRQGHGLIGYLGEVRQLDISGGGSVNKEYPLRLTVFKRAAHLKMGSLASYLHSDKLVDTGHLMDDYIIESIVGWEMRESQSNG